MSLDLFPETLSKQLTPNPPDEASHWKGVSVCKWGHPRVEARLIPKWTVDTGWTVGWLANVEKCLDEWHPSNPNAWRSHSSYPWYRLDEMPNSVVHSVACGTASRALRIVLEQFLASGYVPTELHNEVRAVSDQIETQARAWFTGTTTDRQRETHAQAAAVHYAKPTTGRTGSAQLNQFAASSSSLAKFQA